ncbi:MAG TPA: cysteine desulfurase [Gemmatimonadales bacterium]|jgi:cysteine desulfurase/selenocysteine lyase|nr:cysteine desulfurase [Gemmatimonadales bacterium]
MTQLAAVPPREPRTGRSAAAWNVAKVRADFPILSREVRGRPLVYLDNAATAQKPRAVIEAITRYYESGNANVHRGVHALSQEATDAYERVRELAARFFNVSQGEIVFTAGTTAALNLVAQSYGGTVLRPGDEILVSEMEHHSNLVPWQLVAERTGASVLTIPVSDEGALDLAGFERLLGPRTRIVAVTHASNVLGAINPINAIAAMAHERGAVVVVDGAQSAPHLRVDLRAIDCDFFACSGHKLYGPTGIGLLFGKRALLEQMPPWQGGGGMIAEVRMDRSTYAPPPERFEAGTPPIAEVVGLGAAIEYVLGWDWEALVGYEQNLVAEAVQRLEKVPGLRILGEGADRVSVLSVVLDGIHPHDAGTVLDSLGIAVRAGHHCAQPLMRRFGVPGTLRASFGAYTTLAEIEALVAGLGEVAKVFAR